MIVEQESGDSSEVRDKPRGVGDASREGAKMNAVEVIVALYQWNLEKSWMLV